MRLHPRVPRSSVELVQRFEGLRRKAARTPGGGWTVGYGHTASAREGVEVSAEDAEALLLFDLSRVAYAVEDAVLCPLTENQFGALVAFAFNVGVEQFARSAVLKRLNEGAYLRAAAALELWRRSDFEGESIVVDALVRRRAAEKLLFLTPTEGFRPAPTPLIPPQLDIDPLRAADELEAPLDDQSGEVRLDRLDALELDEQSPPAVAARSVIERLNAILADEPIASSSVIETAHASEPGTGDPLQPPEEPEPPFLEPEAVTEPAPPPPVVTFRTAFREVASEPARRWDTFEERTYIGRARPKVVEAPMAPMPRKAAKRERRTGFVLLALGVFGLALFVAALATIVFGRATLTNLALGMFGVAAMVPAAVRLLGGWSGRD